MKLASLEAIARALDDARAPFLIAGGVAVNAHGYGRLTQDLDLIIRLAPDVVARRLPPWPDSGMRRGCRSPRMGSGIPSSADGGRRSRGCSS